MSGKKMEGDETQRRSKGRDARRSGHAPSEENVTSGASKQRLHLGDEDHPTKLEAIRRGKQHTVREGVPEPRPGSRGAPRDIRR